MYSLHDKSASTTIDAGLIYLNADKPVDSLLSVIVEAVTKRDATVVFEKNTAKRLLRDHVADGYDLYLLALVFEYLVENTDGPVFAGKLCSVPALVAGLAAVDSTAEEARYEYWYRYALDKKKYIFWFYRLQDALEAGEGEMVKESKKHMDVLLKDGIYAIS